MSNKTFLVVFHGQWLGNKIVDIGDDPCFDNLPSWGICRPLTRKAINIGDTMFFFAKIQTNYFLKGWFKVGDKLDYLSALTRFPKRQNVIISKSNIVRPNNWRYKDQKEYYEKYHSTTIPHFLLKILTKEGTFYQNPIDNHELDNWKCRRIFNCRTKDFFDCVVANHCLKDGCSLAENKFKNYIIADKNDWEVTDKLKITFSEICLATGFNKPIMTPRHQHNILRFDDYKEKMLDYITERKNDA